LSENLEGSDPLEDLGVDGRIILKGELRKWGGRTWTEFIWLRTATMGELL
jgi:hypothetical protein